MPSLSSKDRVSLCLFTFDDGRRCRTPRVSTSPHFCFYHAQKEAQFRANETIADDLDYFFSGDYLSANDLNTALGRVFVAVARGDLNPRAARTLAYLAQTMLQTLHLAQNEFISACGEKDWRDTVVESMNTNQAYRFPEPTKPAPPQTQTPVLAPTPPQPQPPTPSPTPVPASTPVQSAPPAPKFAAPATAETRPAPAAAPTPTPTPNANSSPVGVGLARPEPPTTRAASQPATQPTPPPRPATQTRDPHAVHYGPNYRLIVDGKPFSKHT
jgi:outer membrane biosynthesis protein TonB